MKYKYRYSGKQYIRILLITLCCLVLSLVLAYVSEIFFWGLPKSFSLTESLSSFFENRLMIWIVVGVNIVFVLIPLIAAALLTEIEFFDRKVRVRVPRGRLLTSVWIPYTDIYAIRAVKYPLIGFYGIRIKSTTYGGNVTISRHIQYEQQFIAMLCRNVHSMRPNAVIDEELLQIAKAVKGE